MLPTEETIAALEDLARDPEAMVEVAWLVSERFMQLPDIDDLKGAGLKFFLTDDEGARIIVGAREFLAAAQTVADSRALDVVAEVVASSGTVH